MVRSTESSHETSNIVGNLHGGQGEFVSIGQFAWNITVGVLFYWSKSKGADFCEVLSCLEIALSVPVGFKGLNVTLDLLVVEGVVRGELFCKLFWLLEDGSPVLDGSQVVTHALAGFEGWRDLGHGETELEASLDVIIKASLLDVCNSGFNLIDHRFSALVAFLDLIKIVVSSHSIDESSNEVWNCHGSNVNGVSEHFGNC